MAPEASASDAASCSWIRAHDPALLPLVKVCEQWQSTARSNLPDFICQQETVRTTTVHQPMGSVFKRIDKVTAQVTFENGRDSYSDFKLNGRPVERTKLQFGMWSEGEFGPLVLIVLNERSAPELKKTGEAKIDGEAMDVFGYSITQANNRRWLWRAGPKEAYYPAFSGSIVVNKASGQLKRLVQVAKDIDPSVRLDYLAVQTDYADTKIEGLGTFLLPARSLWLVCYQGAGCANNVLTFHDCRKFAAKARIVPDSVQP